ncbi:MAG TPA: RsmE family RNA methyltransferase [Actinomycetota bacterium]|nr:RsmE family RNA methyltransferase [Actinomycetota bacterium]
MSRTEHHGHFFTDPSYITDAAVVLRDANAHHLKVRRAKPGDRIHVGDGAGRLVEAEILTAGSAEVLARVVESRTVERPSTRLAVFQGIAKSGKVDWVVEKLVELGVDEVAVFAAGRSVPVWESAKGEVLRARWERVALAASKQSRRAWIPQVSGPLDPAEFLKRVKAVGSVLVADPSAHTSLGAFLADLGRPPEVGVVIGPEGGLTREEIEALVEAGATPVTLGSQILRTETAGLALSAVVLHHLGRLG